jgi:flagellar biosynthesis protein FlhG
MSGNAAFATNQVFAENEQQLTVPERERKIWVIGGGKGGVGKSFIISNLAVALARTGKKILMADLDLGAANLHTMLGSEIPRKTLSDFFSGRVNSLNALVTDSAIPNVQFVSGANDSLDAANITPEQHAALMKQLLKLSCDYLLIDLGAGSHSSTLDYFLMADRRIVAITPEPTSIENAYRFIKAAYFKWIKNLETKFNLKALVDHAMDHKNDLGIRTPNDLLLKITQLNPEAGEVFRTEVEKFEIFIVMNLVRGRQDVETASAVKSVCNKYFGINAHNVGYLDYDNAVWQAVRKRKSLSIDCPSSRIIGEFVRIVRQLNEHQRNT